jgi:hypothetical protein
MRRWRPPQPIDTVPPPPLPLFHNPCRRTPTSYTSFKSSTRQMGAPINAWTTRSPSHGSLAAASPRPIHPALAPGLQHAPPSHWSRSPISRPQVVWFLLTVIWSIPFSPFVQSTQKRWRGQKERERMLGFGPPVGVDGHWRGLWNECVADGGQGFKLL